MNVQASNPQTKPTGVEPTLAKNFFDQAIAAYDAGNYSMFVAARSLVMVNMGLSATSRELA